MGANNHSLPRERPDGAAAERTRGSRPVARVSNALAATSAAICKSAVTARPASNGTVDPTAVALPNESNADRVCRDRLCHRRRRGLVV